VAIINAAENAKTLVLTSFEEKAIISTNARAIPISQESSPESLVGLPFPDEGGLPELDGRGGLGGGFGFAS
jgi:hypothetical protein